MLQVQSWVAQPTLSVNGNSLLPEQWNQRWKEGGDERPWGNLLHFSLFFGNAFPCSHRFSSIQFSLPVMSNSLRPMDCSMPGFPVPSPTPRAYSNSCPSSQWCHPTVSFSVIQFSSCLHSFPASGSFPMSQFFASSGQSTGVLASASVLPMKIWDWFALAWTGWISLQTKGLSRVFSNIAVQKHQFFGAQLSLWSNSNTHTWLLEKPQLCLDGTLLAK